ncbi:related to BUD2 - GTPase-activating protein for Bud1p/Rsr1p [Cephalotrichum gorgonifer]|uniref:Related to BUD2 - GTPase-activating protein for Bud1p/Rsr1p n=1 Tax=Cephalotrichum gorgonifer TaxID=2041049 RepID=A0AAE8N826_9PEZI|nr:related to BUD2 - GTPase-activating protein for Bud1p/Rsr1p [Cephalotrichum gorgonifer]
MDKPSAGNLRPPSSFSASASARTTIRAVTPEAPDRSPLSPRVLAATITTTSDPGVAPPTNPMATTTSAPTPSNPVGLATELPPQLPTRPRAGPGLGSPHLSPSALASEPARRQGMVFNDSFDGPSEDHPDDPLTLSLSSSPPAPRVPPRQRTYTLEATGGRHPPISLATATDTRRRMGSFSATGSQPQGADSQRTLDVTEPFGHSSISSTLNRQAETAHLDQYQSQRAQLTKDKKAPTRRLVKRQSSRPTSPQISPPPSVDSLPLPIPTEDANKVLLLMKNLCGRMRGDVEYQLEAGGTWITGMAYIEEEKGSLMIDRGDDRPFHLCLIADLRGCRVIPVDYPEKKKYNCLEIVANHPPVDLILRPLVLEEADLWLAALLCWQQLRPVSGPMTNGKPTSPVAPTRPELQRHTSSNGQNVKPTSIIKVGRVMLWDKGLAMTPRAIVKRPSTRDLRSPTTAWRWVSCILQDNGELKLLTETDSSILSVIELSQLSRSAIQPLDRTVLDQEFCISIFPIYATTSTQLSIFRPVYIALETRVHFEVWYVLLRAFAVPDLYRLDPKSKDGIVEMTDTNSKDSSGVFRIEKSLALRVTEAKMRSRTFPPFDVPVTRGDTRENVVGNYLAEVILDGEVRARTSTMNDTKNPFWRADSSFQNLPPSVPYLSVILKRVEGGSETSTSGLQSTLSVPKIAAPTEILCGSVDIPLDELERGKDHEQWLQILDDKQQSIGTMLVRLHHEELAVLLGKEYEPLSELLHRFPSGLTSQIADVIPSGLRRLAEIFLNIFQVSGSAAEWLMALVEDEIDGIGNQTAIKKYRFSRRLRSTESLESTSDREQIVRDMSRSLTGEANLLFRGNSLLTQALEFHMRRLGKEYLQDVLLDKISEINDLNPDCEIDPSRIQNADELQQHWNQLIQITTEVWRCIAGSANRLPPELRHILKYIRAVAEDRYGDFLRTVSYTSVSGFLFLRFICPAILSPKLFGLLRDFPRPRAQRTLTLVAKTLQALANMTTFGQKEGWMEPMNKFLSGQRGAMKEFIDHVCSIPADRSTNPVPASYTTPVTILGRLSPTAREGFPSLPYLVDQSRNFAALVRFWVDANPLAGVGSSPTAPHTAAPTAAGLRTEPLSPRLQRATMPLGIDAKVESDEDDLMVFNDLCTSIQQRADESLAKVEAFRVAERDSANAAEEDASARSPRWDDEVVEFAPEMGVISTSRPPGSSGSDGGLDGRGRSMATVAAGGEGRDTLRSSRNGRVTRGLLSGIMRMGRSDSPDAPKRS